MFERHAAAVALAAMMWVGAASAQDFAGGVQVGTGKLEVPGAFDSC